MSTTIKEVVVAQTIDPEEFAVTLLDKMDERKAEEKRLEEEAKNASKKVRAFKLSVDEVLINLFTIAVALALLVAAPILFSLDGVDLHERRIMRIAGVGVLCGSVTYLVQYFRLNRTGIALRTLAWQVWSNPHGKFWLINVKLMTFIASVLVCEFVD